MAEARANRRWLAALAAAVALAAPLVGRGAGEGDAARGAYVFNAADCVGCHTDVKGGGKRLAGGRPLATPFGTFFSPNITPDKEHGIGTWSLADFTRAIHEGISPAGHYYFPVFPYASFTGMSDQDVADLYAYLMAQEPVAQANKPHQVGLPFRWRFLQFGWRMLFFDEGRFRPDPTREAEWNRGAYLVRAVAHCGECHTPRNVLGGLKESRFLSGNPTGPDNQNVPNITSDKETGIGNWSADEIAELLKSGQTPEFDFVGGGMGEVVSGTKTLTDEDRRAIAAYLKTVPAIHTVKQAKQKAAD